MNSIYLIGWFFGGKSSEGDLRKKAVSSRHSGRGKGAVLAAGNGVINWRI
jgi:hypothetical protein